jgi:hypothetical protein
MIKNINYVLVILALILFLALISNVYMFYRYHPEFIGNFGIPIVSIGSISQLRSFLRVYLTIIGLFCLTAKKRSSFFFFWTILLINFVAFCFHLIYSRENSFGEILDFLMFAVTIFFVLSYDFRNLYKIEIDARFGYLTGLVLLFAGVYNFFLPSFF